jgi:cellulase (glycosyl hydrolase family 5)
MTHAFRVAAAVIVCAAVIGVPAAAHAAIPTQWIAKVTTESAGRAPTAGEWKFWIRYYGPRTCGANTLKTLGAAAYKSSGFRGRGYDHAEKLLALFRGALNREPRKSDVDFHLPALRDGSLTWSELVDEVFNSTEFRNLSSKICDPVSPGYGFDQGPVGDLRAWAVGAPSRTQQELQVALDNARATCGTVTLQRKEVIRIGGAQPGPEADNHPLRVPTCVTLTTAGAPDARHYAQMARLVPKGLICSQPWPTCDHIELVRVSNGARLSNVWVDGKGLNLLNFKIGLVGVESGQATTRVVDNRLSDPPVDGTAVRATGYGTTRIPCSGRNVSRNLVTGYATQHAQTRLGKALWADGLSIFCEQATVQDNHIIDISDTGIVVYGSWNSAGALNSAGRERRTQRSTVSGNQIVSAGNSAHIALGADAVGECLANRDGPPVSCIEFSDDRGSADSERSFAGTTVTGNTFWTGPRTHFDAGLMIGSASLWGDNGPSARGASFTNNTVGGVTSTRVHIGIAVSGMYSTVLRGNTASYRLIDTNPAVTEKKCPRGNVLYGYNSSTLAPGSQPATGSSGLFHCFTHHPPAGGMERITVGPGRTLVGSVSGQRFKPWGQNDTLGNSGVDHKVNVTDLREVKQMGSNTLRLHLQFKDFMSSCTTANQAALDELGETLRRAEENGVYLDLTGLASYHGDASDPACYRNATESERWAAQEVFWKAVAQEVAGSPAVLVLDLMNEPRVPESRVNCWTTNGRHTCGPPFGGYYFVHWITQTPFGRSSDTIARAWVTRMRSAIRTYDSQHLITLGCLPFPNCAGLDPATTAPLLDYLSVHINPDGDDTTSDEMDILSEYSATGDPVVVEETYLVRNQDPAIMRAFILNSRAHATGWLGHWGDKTLSQVMVAGNFIQAVWGTTFQRLTKTVSPCGACQP